MYYVRSVPAWHVATRWDAFELADSISADSAGLSKIGEGEAEAASLIGAAAQGREAWGARSKLLKVSEGVASVEA